MSVTVDKLQEIIDLLAGKTNVRYHRVPLNKASTFTDTPIGVRDYNLIMISTDGDQSTVTYKMRTKDNTKFTDAIQAELIPKEVGEIDELKVSSSLAEAGKTVFIDMWEASGVLIPAIVQGSFASVRLEPNIEKASLKETNKVQNTDWLASNVSPTKANSMHRIFVTVTGNTVPVYIHLDDSGESFTNKKILIEKGTALVQDAGYIFDLPLSEGQSYNIQHDTNTATVQVFIFEYSNVTG